MTGKAEAIRIINEAVEHVSVEALKVHPQNPRRGDLDAIVASIAANGFYGALVVQRSTGYVLAGNHRLMAAVQAGLKQVPVAWVDVDDVRALAILAADNRTSDMGTYDDEQLAHVLQQLSDEGALQGTGYDAGDLHLLMESLAPQFDPVDQASDLGVISGTPTLTCPSCGHCFMEREGGS